MRTQQTSSKEKQASKKQIVNFKSTPNTNFKKGNSKKKANQTNDEMVINFDPKLSQFKYGAVVKLTCNSKLPKLAKSCGRVIITVIKHEKNYAVATVGSELFTIPFSDVDKIIQKPIKQTEKDLPELREMCAVYHTDTNTMNLRWFFNGKVIADFYRTSFDKPINVVVEENEVYQKNFKSLIRKFERYLKAHGINVNDLEIIKPNTDLDRFTAIFNLVYDYLSNRQCYLYDFKTYLKIIKN